MVIIGSGDDDGCGDNDSDEGHDGSGDDDNW